LSLYTYFAFGVLARGQSAFKLLAEATRTLAFLGLFIGGSIAGIMIWYEGLNDSTQVLRRVTYLPWTGLLLALPALWTAKGSIDRKVSMGLSVSFVLLAVFTTMPLVLGLGEHEVWGTLLSIVLWWALAVTAVYAGHKRIFDTITLMITIRILVVYFEVFGSMLETGIGLVISGIMILGLAWVWYRFRDRLAGMVRRT
jgi:uncharacterized membrane protein